MDEVNDINKIIEDDNEELEMKINSNEESSNLIFEINEFLDGNNVDSKTIYDLALEQKTEQQIYNIMLYILEKYPFFFNNTLLFSEDGKQQSNIEANSNLYDILNNLLDEEQIKNISYMKIINILDEFSNLGYIEKISSEEIKKLHKYARAILSAPEPIFEDKKGKTEFNYEKTKETLGKGVRFRRSNLYVSKIFQSEKEENKYIINENAAQKLLNYLKEIISIGKKINYEEFMNKEYQKPILKKQEKKSSKDFTYLHKFKEQHFFEGEYRLDDIKSIQDIEMAFESVFNRICRNCGHHLTHEEIENYLPFSMIFTSNFSEKYILYEKINIAVEELTQARKSNRRFNLNKFIDEEPTILNFAQNQNQIKEIFKCPHCKTNIFKKPLLHVIRFVMEIINQLRDGIMVVLVGNAGDGKSRIANEFVNYLEWRYGVGYIIQTNDVSTTPYQTKGGFDPSAFGNPNVNRIHYGELSKALLNPNFIEGGGKNIVYEEMNRTLHKNRAFLMPFYADPYLYVLEVDEGRIFMNPNHIDGIIKWFSIATINLCDIGTEPMSLAQKSRFFLLPIIYEKEEFIDIINIYMNGLSESERFILTNIMEKTEDLVNSDHLLFNAGIRHYLKFFKNLRNTVIDLNNGLLDYVYRSNLIMNNLTDKDKKDEKNKYILSKQIYNLIIGNFVNPLVDETSIKLIESITSDLTDDLTSIIEYIYKDIKNNTFNYYN